MADLIPTTDFSYLKFRQFAPDSRLSAWVQCFWTIGRLDGSHQCPDTKLRLGFDLRPRWLGDLMRVVEGIRREGTIQGVVLLEAWLLSMAARHLPADSATMNVVQEIDRLSLSPQQLADHLGLTQRTLERKLQRDLGVSPGQLLRYVRLRDARYLLARTTLSLADVALQCGYYDQAHFSHAFRRHTFETPASYRKRKLSQIYKA